MADPTIDLRPFLRDVQTIVQRHELSRPGAYCRWLGEDRSRESNPYGCADAANLLYTLGSFPERTAWDAWTAELQRFQDAGDGLFHESTHDPLHTTAHVAGALQLFEARPAHRLVALDPWKEPAAVDRFLGQLDWSWNPWGGSHRGDGLFAALVLAGEVGADWEERYFSWLANEADPQTGFWRRGHVAVGGEAILFHHLAGSFHYLFNHEYRRRPLRYPEAMLDSCLRIRRDGLFPPLGLTVGFAELDWIYCVHRAARQCPTRLHEARHALAQFASAYTSYLFTLDACDDPGLNDLHQLLGAVSALAELQQVLPDLLRSEQPLRLVLDRRPFA